MELTLEQAFQKGIEAHKAGKAQEADRYYTAVLKAQPKHPNANHNMGVLAVSVGKLEQALPFFKTALEVNPNIAQFWLSYIDALIKLDRTDDARTLLDQAKNHGIKGDGFDQLQKKLAPSIAPKARKNKEPTKDQLQSLVNLYNQGQLQEALRQASDLLTQFPGSVTVYNIVGAANQGLGKLEEATEAYKEAISIKPDYAEAYNNMGNALKDQGKLEEAIEAYSKALSIKPDLDGAYNNASQLLKTYSPKSRGSHCLFNIDDKLKKLSNKILNVKSDRELINNLSEGLGYISEDSYEYKTIYSQIYKRNCVDLNCNRHKKIFETKEVIPEFCFECFKVQVEVDTFIDLIKVTSLFYKFDFQEDLTRKTLIELRSNISGYYKGLIYCKGLDQAKAVKDLLDISLNETFGEKTTSAIKRGCSEYTLKFPSYGAIPENPKKIMSFPKEWKVLEQQFDKNESLEPKDTTLGSLRKFCLSDFYIIQKWIDYAKGIEDKSVKIFNDRPIIFKDIYELAKQRIKN